MERNHLLAVAAALVAKRAIRKKCSKWSKYWLLKGHQFSHINLPTELKFEKDDWFNYLRMDEEIYLGLLQLVTPFIEKKDTRLRKSISYHERLTATLRYLATRRSYEDLKYTTIISSQALGRVIPETCSAIYSVLRKEYLKFPQNEDEWKVIADNFGKKWLFPHCLGAVDGKHVQIVPPPNSGSTYYNYKGYNSLVLMAIANADYGFILCDFGTNGRISDGGVIENTLFYEKLKTNSLKLPPPSKSEKSSSELPFVFIGDEDFALREDFLKPFSQKALNSERRIYNCRFSRARRIIENVFGILAARFRIFHTAISLQLENTEKTLMACCVLHNFLRRKCSGTYISSSDLDREDCNGGETQVGVRPAENTLGKLQRGYNPQASEVAKNVRNTYVHYFNNEGSVPWQEKFV